jgi:hypothetical protein
MCNLVKHSCIKRRYRCVDMVICQVDVTHDHRESFVPAYALNGGQINPSLHK